MIVKFAYGCSIGGVIANSVLLDSGNPQDALTFFRENLADELRRQQITLSLDNVLEFGYRTCNIM